MLGLQLVLIKTNRICDTQYNNIVILRSQQISLHRYTLYFYNTYTMSQLNQSLNPHQVFDFSTSPHIMHLHCHVHISRRQTWTKFQLHAIHDRLQT